MRNTDWKTYISFALFEWAISPASAIILTFIFPTYFVSTLAQANSCEILGISETHGAENCGSLLWGYAATLSAIVIALLAPIMGKWADEGGNHKAWIALYSGVLVLSCAILWMATPGEVGILTTLIAACLCGISVDLCYVFYNAMLPYIAKKKNIGRLSGVSWAAGYFGTITAMGIILTTFIMPADPWIVGKEDYAFVRIAGPACGLWFVVFALPYFLWVEGEMPTKSEQRRKLRDLFTLAWQIEGLVQFSIARMLIADALATTSAFGGILASTEFGFSSQDVLLFGLTMNVAAGTGALVLSVIAGKAQDYHLTIMYTIGLLLSGTAITFAQTGTDFWVAGIVLSFFIGPVQAASRTVYAKLCPENHRTELFGLFVFSGKATAFIGPAMYTCFMYYGQSQRMGMFAVVLLVAIALILLLTNKAMWKYEEGSSSECFQAQ